MMKQSLSIALLSLYLTSIGYCKTINYVPNDVNEINGPKPTDGGSTEDSEIEKQGLLETVSAISSGVQNVLSLPTVQNILSNITVQTVFNDPLVQSVLGNSNVQTVFSNPIVQSIVLNPSFQGLTLKDILSVFTSKPTTMIPPTTSPAPRPTTTTTTSPPEVATVSQSIRPPQQHRPQQNRPQRPMTNNTILTTILNGLDEMINLLEEQIRRNYNRRLQRKNNQQQ